MNKYGPYGLSGLHKIIKDCDVDKSLTLNRQEFENCLSAIGVFFKKHEMTALFLYYDANNDNVISYNEFQSAFQVPLNKRRFALVEKIFRIMDIQKQGMLRPEDVGIFYKPIQHNANFLTKNQANDNSAEFLSHFDLNKDGQISKEEFFEFYLNVGSIIGSDDQFAEMLRNCWGIEEDLVTAPDQILKIYVKLIREKLINLTSGVLDEYKLSTLFKDYDVHRSGLISKPEMACICIKLGIHQPDEVLDALFNKFGQERSSTIDFKSFNNYILYDLYP